MAACVNPNDPLESPSSGVEIFYDIQFPERLVASTKAGAAHDIASGVYNYDLYWPTPVVVSDYELRTAPIIDTWVDPENSGEWPYAPDAGYAPRDEADIFSKIAGQLDGAMTWRADGRPPFGWPNLTDPEQFDRKRLSAIGGALFFYEPDGKGGRRLCRMERWLSRKLASRRIKYGPDREGTLTEPRHNPYLVPTSPKQARNPVLKKLGKTYFLVAYTNLVYNSQGHIPRVGAMCFYYTNDGQVSWVGQSSPQGECLNKKPNPKEQSFIEILFDSKGKGYGAVLTSPYRWKPEDVQVPCIKHADQTLEGWGQLWGFDYKGAYVEATFNDRCGITKLHAFGAFAELDSNTVNRLMDAELHGSPLVRDYDFPTPTSNDVLRRPETLYQHERSRISCGYAVCMVEHFAAGSNKPRSRVWQRTGSDHVLRTEFFNARGRLAQVVVGDFIPELGSCKIDPKTLRRTKTQSECQQIVCNSGLANLMRDSGLMTLTREEKVACRQ